MRCSPILVIHHICRCWAMLMLPLSSSWTITMPLQSLKVFLICRPATEDGTALARQRGHSEQEIKQARCHYSSWRQLVYVQDCLQEALFSGTPRCKWTAGALLERQRPLQMQDFGHPLDIWIFWVSLCKGLEVRDHLQVAVAALLVWSNARPIWRRGALPLPVPAF